MDLKKIFIKDACPTKMGGQAVMEGIMMKGEKKTALAVRIPSGDIEIETKRTKAYGKWMKVPLLRGVIAFVTSLVFGTKVLMYSADVLEKYLPEEYQQDKFDEWIEKKVGKDRAWNILLWLSVIIALIFSIGVFMLLPTAVVGIFKKLTDSVIILNLIEGLVRIGIFIGYIAIIPKLEDINKVFQYHGAEHKTIHCFENGLELTPDNAQTFYTLHPRCGTSFLMFVMIIAIIVHVFMGWPNVWMRVGLRLLALPLIAGISYELLKWAGRSNNKVVEFLSLPGIYLQKLTTRTPNNEQLEVAIAAMKAVIPCETEEEEAAKPYFEGICDLNGEPVEGEVEYYEP